MSKFIKNVTEAAFTEEVKKGTVLVDFFADWCGPCRMMTPVLEKVAEEMSGKVQFVKLDIDNAQETAARFQITSIPTLLLLKDGQETGRLVGLRDAAAIKEFVEG